MSARPMPRLRQSFPRGPRLASIPTMGDGDGIAGDEDSRALLHAWQAGDAAAGDRLFALAHDELRTVAAALLRRERHSSLSSGDLVNEAVLRLIPLERIDWRDKAHFLALSARVMRQVLVDHARARLTEKRDHHRVTLVTGMGAEAPPVDLLDLNAALIELEGWDRDRASLVEMRYFGGMTIDEIVAVTGQSAPTVKRRWRSTRAWLMQAMQERPE
ncbi:ECF-type sigma factor [uncultured Brevundimonas sp.]|nr:ECF-type sigma factor [uncultured Brevundimonas sp.]